MSYEKIKSIGYDKKTGECSIVGAISNLFPIQYSKWEKTIPLYLVFEYVSTGNFHILPSLKRWDYLTTLVCKWYSKTEEYKKVNAFERAKCKVFQDLVDKAMALPLHKVNKAKYIIKIDGEYVQKFYRRKCVLNYFDKKEFDFYTLLREKNRYSTLTYKKVVAG